MINVNDHLRNGPGISTELELSSSNRSDSSRGLILPDPERIMSRQLENYGINILQLHAEWLVANGYKREASSCKQQIRMILINKKKKNQQATSNKLDKPQAAW